jgi:hypothetical protein
MRRRSGRTQPGFSSFNLREIILPHPASPKATCGDEIKPTPPSAMILTSLSNRYLFKFLRFCVSANTQRGVAYPGLVQLFTNGALFIDDFESAPRNLQETRLRIMSTRRGHAAAYRKVGGNRNEETNAWLIFATNSAVDKLLHDERLREDFLYRFEDRVVMIPPLKERPAAGSGKSGRIHSGNSGRSSTKQ